MDQVISLVMRYAENHAEADKSHSALKAISLVCQAFAKHI